MMLMVGRSAILDGDGVETVVEGGKFTPSIRGGRDGHSLLGGPQRNLTAEPKLTRDELIERVKANMMPKTSTATT